MTSRQIWRKLRQKNERLKTLNIELKEAVGQREVRLKVHKRDIDLEQYTRRISIKIYGLGDKNKLETT